MTTSLNPSDNFIRNANVAKLLSCSTRTVRRLQQKGSLPKSHIGSVVGVWESELQRALNRPGPLFERDSDADKEPKNEK
jgi:predicted DNA-binding transcriptional regulator AlpA